jgi:hypothetical protein
LAFFSSTIIPHSGDLFLACTLFVIFLQVDLWFSTQFNFHFKTSVSGAKIELFWWALPEVGIIKSFDNFKLDDSLSNSFPFSW